MNRITANSIPEPNSGCWLWLGNVQKSGHGRLKWHGRTTLAHRLSWELHRGPIPPGMLVCHTCDMGGCVNPDHLFIGTHADNHADRNRKGRQARGERGGQAKLTATDVIAIRADPRRVAVIARAYGMGWSQIARIKKREWWKHLP